MPEVFVFKGDAYESTRKILKRLRLRKLVKGKEKIVIKPNLVVPIHSSKGVTTDVNVVRAVLDFLENKATIVEGSTNATRSFEVNGYNELKKDYDIELIDLNLRGKWRKVKVKDPLVFKEMEISNYFIDSDFLISIGKLKVHSVAKFTGSLKNLMGLCSMYQKFAIHAFLPYSLVDLVSIRKPNVGIIDGIVANEIDENLPHPVRMNLILGSEDCVALDRVASKLIGIDRVEYLEGCWLKGLGEIELSKIKIRGKRIEEVGRNFKTASFNPRSYTQKLFYYPLFKLNLLRTFCSFTQILKKFRA